MEIPTQECGECNVHFIPFQRDYLCPACRGVESKSLGGIERVLIEHYDKNVSDQERLLDVAYVADTVFIDLIEIETEFDSTKLRTKATAGVKAEDLISALKALGVLP